MNKISLLVIFFFLSMFASGQTFTEKDFKLMLEGHPLTDSTISYSELTKLNKVSANFTWLKVHELTITYGGTCYGGNGYFEVTCKSDSICPNAILPKRFFAPGTFIVIASSNTTNKSGKKVSVKPLLFKLTE